MLYLQNVGLALALFALAAVGIYHILNRIVWLLAPRREWSHHNTYSRRPDSAEQLRWVMAGTFERKRVMSKPEYRVFKEIEAEAAACKGGYRVFAQTSLGEVLRSTDRRAHSAINSKRSDILVIGPDGFPILAVESGRGALSIRRRGARCRETRGLAEGRRGMHRGLRRGQQRRHPQQGSQYSWPAGPGRMTRTCFAPARPSL